MRSIITVIGKDRKGIIAGISTELAGAGINILDISQTIMQEYFVMIMLVDMSGASDEFYNIQRKLDKKGGELGVEVRMQREDIFNVMHQI
jgi:ACT domain-containing protein